MHHCGTLWAIAKKTLNPCSPRGTKPIGNFWSKRQSRKNIDGHNKSFVGACIEEGLAGMCKFLGQEYVPPPLNPLRLTFFYRPAAWMAQNISIRRKMCAKFKQHFQLSVFFLSFFLPSSPLFSCQVTLFFVSMCMPVFYYLL